MRDSDSPAYLGIMVCETPGDPPFPEHQYYRRLCLIGLKLGIVVFVFFPNRLNFELRRVAGFTYSPELRKWCEVWFPFPQVIYDRCFYGSKRDYRQARHFVQNLKNSTAIRFLGHGLRGKWHVHEMFMRDAGLHAFIPETALLQDPAELIDWLERKGELFLKPQAGSQGRGVLHVKRIGPDEYSVRGRDGANRKIAHTFRRLKPLLEWIGSFVGHRTYLIQQYLTLSTHNGEPFDVRSLVQKNRKGRWQITGMAVRRGKPDGVTSNLHGGGDAEELVPFLQSQFDAERTEAIRRTLIDLSLRIPEVLEQYHGRLAELGIDLGVDSEGKVWILEANSKPGRSVFRRLSDPHARMFSVSNPILYARYLLDTTRRVTS